MTHQTMTILSICCNQVIPIRGCANRLGRGFKAVFEIFRALYNALLTLAKGVLLHTVVCNNYLRLVNHYFSPPKGVIQMNKISEYQAIEMTRELIDDCEPNVKICGMEYTPSRVLELVDPVAFRCIMLDMLDSENLEIE